MGKWSTGNEIHLTSVAHGQNIRANPSNPSHLDSNGAQGAWATWIVEKAPGRIVKLRNKQTHKYLRVNPQGVTDIEGNGGEWCLFEVIKHGAGVFSFRAVKAGGHLGILPGGTPKPASQTGTGPHGQFKFVSGGNKKSGQKRWQNGAKCHLKSAGSSQNLRVNPQNHAYADGHGGQGGLATWTVQRPPPTRGVPHRGKVIMLKNQQTGKFLRINQHAMLDVEGTGGEWCHLIVRRISPAVYCFESAKHPGAHVGILANGQSKPARETGVGQHGQFTYLKA